MINDEKLKSEAISICHERLSFFTPRTGYVADSNIVQCMIDFAKSDTVKEYYSDAVAFSDWICKQANIKESCSSGMWLLMGDFDDIEKRITTKELYELFLKELK